MVDQSSIKHLEMIQKVIDRLAGNSFQLKEWCITLVVALFALAAKDANERYVIIALLPAFGFWAMDGLYLWQERLFRALYDAVRLESKLIPPFSMSTAPVKNEVEKWFKIMLSKTVIWFYGPIITVIIGLTL